jgi:hypothetical protein
MRRVLLAALVVCLAAPAAAHAHRVRLAGPAQFDVTVAQVRYAVPHGPRPALRLALAGPTGLDSQATNVLAATPASLPPACALGSLAVSDLRLALHAGTPPPGFGARSTVVDALAAACRRAVPAAFLQAVAPPATTPPFPPRPSPCPPCPPVPPGNPKIICPTPAPAVCPGQA